ncbi:hypothetical protein ACVOMV_28700 [Mesorhizobium atlanticum]
MLNIARGFGSARMGKDDNGDPMIYGRVEGVKYVIYFYGCEDHENCSRCSSRPATPIR